VTGTLMVVRNGESGVVDGVRRQANLTTSPVVARTTASTVQDRCPGLPVSKRPGTVVLGRWLSTRLRRPSASTPFVWVCDLHRPTYTDYLRLPVFCRCWPTSVELFLPTEL